MIAGASTLETLTVGFTPTQQRMLNLLSDGLPHSREAMLECLQDEHCSPTGHLAHLTAIRKVLRPKGEDVLCEYRQRRPFYRHVRLLASAHDGYK
jgi:hypothetical protein